MSETFSTASITLQNLTKEFGSLKAVDDVNLEIAAGTLVCLLGPSGCGKTTTLRMIAGFEEPTTGRILIGAEDVTDMPPYIRPTAMVFQSYALFPHMSIYDNVAYGLRARRLRKAEIQERVREIIKLMELEGHEKKSPAQLSGGQQQRVALARALVVRPKVLLFDEPLSNLDAQLRVRMRSEIRSLQRQLGITSVYVTHDQEEAFSLADQVAIMNRGHLVQLGMSHELYYQPADRFVAEFVGLSNIIPVELIESNSGGAVVRVLGQNIRSRRPPQDPHGRLSIVLRPETLRIEKAGQPGVPARVLSLAFTGPLARYTVAAGDGVEIVVDMHNPSPDEFMVEGTPVTLKLPSEVPALIG
jgi:iron(III) transport system ATP-binding protein